MNKEKWINRNCFESNQEYTEKVLKRFEINKYHFACSNGNTILLIEQGLNRYKLEIDCDNCVMNIYRCKVNLNFSKHTKENMVLKKSFNDDCIWNCIKWIYNDSKL